MLGKVPTHDLVFLVFWSRCLFSFQTNRKMNGLCDVLQPCCHAVAVSFEIFHCWSPTLWSHQSAGFLAVTQTIHSPVLQVGAVSFVTSTYHSFSSCSAIPSSAQTHIHTAFVSSLIFLLLIAVSVADYLILICLISVMSRTVQKKCKKRNRFLWSQELSESFFGLMFSLTKQVSTKLNKTICEVVANYQAALGHKLANEKDKIVQFFLSQTLLHSFENVNNPNI